MYYPSAREWMWNYCIYLGPFTDSQGNNYDLGIYMDSDEFIGVSAAIVYGNENGEYLSGTLSWGNQAEAYCETLKRARSLCILDLSKFK